MKQRLSLADLEVQSFVTKEKKQTAVGGSLFITACGCNTMQCSEAYTICCPDTETKIPICL